MRGNCKKKGGPYALKTSKTEELTELEAGEGEPSGGELGFFSLCHRRQRGGLCGGMTRPSGSQGVA